ncbi:unnamed protein product [Pylaiella littoralis]
MKHLILLLWAGAWAVRGTEMDTDQHSTPRRQSLGSRPAITPSLSVQRAEDGRRKRRTSGRAPAGTDAASTSTKEEGAEYPPGFRRGRAGIDEAKLPVYKFLQQGVREEGGQPFEIQQGATQRMALPVNNEEREEVVRAATWRNADHVFETRST